MLKIVSGSLSSSGTMNLNYAWVRDKIENSGKMTGQGLFFAGKEIKNSGSMDITNFVIMPNATTILGGGQFHTHVLFGTKALINNVPKSYYDEAVIIPDHADQWNIDQVEDYLVSYIETHPDFIA